MTLAAGEGDIILPLGLCVLRCGETFKQWTARAKHCSIEEVRQTTGGTLRAVAERLRLTPLSLKSPLQRAQTRSERNTLPLATRILLVHRHPRGEQ